MVILGIDPGYATVGFGFIRYAAPRFAPGKYGAILTSPNDEFGTRLATIYRSVCELIDQFKPDVLSIERLYYANNAKTVIGVAEARGVVLLAAEHKGVPVYEYTPLQVKQAVTGYGQAPKDIEEFYARLEGLTTALLDNPMICAFCYTQLTDVYQETNGIYNFDRTEKFDMERIHAIFTKKAAIEE